METLDPVLVRAMKLMHSTSKSSVDQLKALLDDALAQRRSQLKLPDVKIRASAEKRSLDTKIKEAGDVNPSMEKKRKMMQMIPTPNKSRSLSSSPDPSSASRAGSMSLSEAKAALKENPPSQSKSVKQEDDSEATDIEENDKESDSDKNMSSSSQDVVPIKREEESFTSLENFEDLACVSCGSMEQKPGNNLVECQECHSLYHQECHKPPPTSQDISDPRTIWYCAKCTKTMKKTSSGSSSTGTKSKGGVFSSSSSSGSSTSKVATTASSAFEAAINQGKESALILVKERQNKKVVESTSSTFSFKRTEPKASASPSSTASKPIGLAGLATSTTRLQQIKKKVNNNEKKKK